MKRNSLCAGVGKIASCVVVTCFATLLTSIHVLAAQLTLPEGKSIELDNPLTGELQSRFGDGWARAAYIDKTGARFQLFQDEQLTKVGGVIFEALDRSNVSPTGRYLVMYVVRQGLLDVAGEKSRIEGREYCPVMETATGCIVTMQTGEVCGGGWASKQDAWLDLNEDRTAEMTKRSTLDANSVWHEFSRARVKLQLRDVIASNLGVANVMACDPPKLDNQKSYLALAEQLRRENAGSEASIVELKVAVASRVSTVSGQTFTVCTEKAWLYDSPSPDSKTKMYVVRGDQVASLNVIQGEWVEIDFKRANGHILHKWIRKSSICTIK